MNSLKAELLIQPIVNPKALVSGLARITHVLEECAASKERRGRKSVQALAALGHASLLEPLRFAVVVHGASRVFLAQITRHRHSTFISQSQQYQDDSGFPGITIPGLEDHPDLLEDYVGFMKTADALYAKLKEVGIPQDSSPYIVPGRAPSELFIDANAREWVETIFPQRICRRNTIETRQVMSIILNVFVDNGYWSLFKQTGPACLTAGKCDQGVNACGRPFTYFEELLDTENI